MGMSEWGDRGRRVYVGIVGGGDRGREGTMWG